MERFDWSLEVHFFFTYEPHSEKQLFLFYTGGRGGGENCFASREGSSRDTPSSSHIRYSFCFLFAVLEIQPHTVHVAILHPLSARKLTKVIAQIFICCSNHNEMECPNYQSCYDYSLNCLDTLTCRMYAIYEPEGPQVYKCHRYLSLSV